MIGEALLQKFNSAKAVSVVCLLLWNAGVLLESPSSAQQSSVRDRQGQAKGSSSAELELTRFYEVPRATAAGKPGDLIRSEEFDGYEVPFDVTALRILYWSQAASGAAVAVSGVVLVPDRDAPARGWPVIAWAHPFTGAARRCAPSLRKNLHTGPSLSMYAKLGYAVVASDYAGLGTDVRNAALDVQSNASDVMYALVAARRALPQLGAKWMAIGEGDGAVVALALSEMKGQTEDPNYLGSIAMSGPADLKTEIERVQRGPWQDRMAFLAYGIKTVYPDFSVNDMLTAKALPAYAAVSETCSLPGLAAASNTEMLRPNWESNPYVVKFVERNTVGSKPARAPLLLITADDSRAAGSSTAELTERMCAQGDQVDVETFPGVDPGSLVGESASVQASWIKARFAGRTVPNTCSK